MVYEIQMFSEGVEGPSADVFPGSLGALGQTRVHPWVGTGKLLLATEAAEEAEPDGRGCSPLPSFVHSQLATAPTPAFRWARCGQAPALVMGTRSAIAAPRILCSRGLWSGSARATGSGVERSPSAAVSSCPTLLRLPSTPSRCPG